MKKVGIVGGMLIVKEGNAPGYARFYVNEEYVNAVEKAGGAPLILPVVSDMATIKAQINSCDAVIMTGGIDINPQRYGAEPKPLTGEFSDILDKYQMDALNFALRKDKPILCICRGTQLLNVVCGGTIHQDLRYYSKDVLKHAQESPRSAGSHYVKKVTGSILDVLAGESAFVNSYHHQSIDKVGKDLRVIATAADGIIEAIQMDSKKCVFGVQWHPEMMIRKDDAMLPLFKKILEP